MHDGPASFRFEIEGSLAGSAAMELEQSWRTASSVIGNRPLVIAFHDVSRIDPCGRALLLAWRQGGAQFIAKSPLARILVGAILGQPVLSVRVTKHDGWIRFGRLAVRLIPLTILRCPVTVDAANFAPATLKAWEECIAFASLRMEQRFERWQGLPVGGWTNYRTGSLGFGHAKLSYLASARNIQRERPLA
jgi:hypothetical protein